MKEAVTDDSIQKDEWKSKLKLLALHLEIWVDCFNVQLIGLMCRVYVQLIGLMFRGSVLRVPLPSEQGTPD